MAKEKLRIASRAFYVKHKDADYDIEMQYLPYAGELVYAQTSGKARYKFFLGSEYGKEEFINIKVTRAKDWDLIMTTCNEDAQKLTDEQIRLMAHCIGHDYYKVKPYRNYFYGLANYPEWNTLVELGMAIKQEKDLDFVEEDTGKEVKVPYVYFYLNERGLAAVKSTQPKQRHQLEKAQY